MTHGIKPTQKITLINNKGGVGKTTMTYNIGFQLATMGCRVLLVDADSQCNLSLLALDVERSEDLGLFADQTIYHVVKPLIDGLGDIDLSIVPKKLTDNIDILPGHILFGNFDDTLNTAYNEVIGQTASSRGFRVISALKRYIHEMSIINQYDIVIYDVSPSLVGSINRTIMMGSDFFVTIANPDIFSRQGIVNLGKKLSQWNSIQHTINTIAQRNESTIPASQLLPGQPYFLGYIINEHNIYAQKPIADHESWISQVKPIIDQSLSQAHTINGLGDLSHIEPLGMTQDYGRLCAISQQNHQPIFEIDEKGLGQEGSIDLLHKAQEQIHYTASSIISRLEKRGK